MLNCMPKQSRQMLLLKHWPLAITVPQNPAYVVVMLANRPAFEVIESPIKLSAQKSSNTHIAKRLALWRGIFQNIATEAFPNAII